VALLDRVRSRYLVENICQNGPELMGLKVAIVILVVGVKEFVRHLDDA
jgi:hypothetical protein